MVKFEVRVVATL